MVYCLLIYSLNLVYSNVIICVVISCPTENKPEAWLSVFYDVIQLTPGFTSNKFSSITPRNSRSLGDCFEISSG